MLVKPAIPSRINTNVETNGITIMAKAANTGTNNINTIVATNTKGERITRIAIFDFLVVIINWFLIYYPQTLSGRPV